MTNHVQTVRYPTDEELWHRMRKQSKVMGESYNDFALAAIKQRCEALEEIQNDGAAIAAQVILQKAISDATSRGWRLEFSEGPDGELVTTGRKGDLHYYRQSVISRSLMVFMRGHVELATEMVKRIKDVTDEREVRRARAKSDAAQHVPAGTQ